MISFESTSHSVTLPNPTFGDTINSSVQLSIRRTLANTQRTTIVSSGEKQFNLTLTNLTITQKAELEDVLSESDEIITYTDSDSNDWDGYITNFPFDFNEIYTHSRSDECIAASDDGGPIERRYSCTIVFKGSSS